MTRSLWILVGALAGTTALAWWASATGAGVPQPASNPPSIREGSVRPGPFRSGHHRTRYFVGGGIHGGK